MRLIMSDSNTDKFFMLRALELAQKAYEIDEIPVGAIVTYNNEIIGEGYNKSISTNDPTAHAEIEAIKKACITIRNYRLKDCNLYVTLEPCSMCAGALIHSRIKKVFFSALEPKAGSIVSNLNLFDKGFINHKIEYNYGILESNSSNLLRKFFKEKRHQQKLDIAN